MSNSEKGFDPPEIWETPSGRIIRPSTIGEGVYATGCVINPTLPGRVVLEFTKPLQTAEALAGMAPRGNDMEVVARVWMTNEHFGGLLAMIQQMIKDPGGEGGQPSA